jgi:hypothetical protein
MNLLLELLEAIGLVSPAVERHVSDTGDDADDGSAKTPYRTIKHAIDANAGRPAGQQLSITLHGKLTESVTLPSNVALQGVESASLTAKTAGPAITIAGTGAGRVTDVMLRNLVVNGVGPYTGDGGVVSVSAADRVTIDGCELQSGFAGRGGGLAVLGSTDVTVHRCKIHDNTAGTPETTLAGANIAPSIKIPTGNGHGGGIFTRDSDVAITGCDVYENEAILFGGGIAISNDQRTGSRVDVLDCEVTHNQVSHPPLGALSAPVTIVRTDVGDPVREAFSDVLVSAANEEKFVSLLHGLNFESGLGGGIGVRSAAAVRIANCYVGVTRAAKEGANRARRGAGISCYIGAYPTIENNEIANNVAGGDGGGISVDQFDPLLPPGTTTAFGVTAMPMVTRSPVAVTDNRIHNNFALEDGGGVYASGNVKLVVTRGVVQANRSAEDGGGLRATYASDLRVVGVKILDNQCNVVGTEADGGGGVATRNANLTLDSCVLTGNVANHFAGGAVYFVSCWEGGIDSTLGVPFRVANQHGTFDEIMEASTGGFNFRTRVLRILNCRGSGNSALGATGAGGFLYAVRSAEPLAAGGVLGGGEAMWVDIEGAATLIGTNTSEHSNAGMRKRGNVVIETSGTVVGTSVVPQDRVYVGLEIPSGAIAQSIPTTPVPAQARAVVHTIDRDATHDASRLTWDGTGYVFGSVPAITAVTPATASTAGGAALTIAGTRFDSPMRVLVGGVEATVTSQTATSIVITSPPGPAGPADVTVIDPSGARATLAAAVTLVAP